MYSSSPPIAGPSNAHFTPDPSTSHLPPQPPPPNALYSPYSPQSQGIPFGVPPFPGGPQPQQSPPPHYPPSSLQPISSPSHTRTLSVPVPLTGPSNQPWNHNQQSPSHQVFHQNFPPQDQSQPYPVPPQDGVQPPGHSQAPPTRPLSGPKSPSPPTSSVVSESHTGAESPSNHQRRNQIPIQDALSERFPQAAELSREDMQDLLADPAYFDAFLHSLPEAKELDNQHEDALRKALEIADKNNSLRPQLETLRDETLQAFGQANKFKAKWEDLEQQQREAYRLHAPAHLLTRLRHSISDQDALSESLSSSFLQGHMEEEEFVRQYREMRKVYWKRETWGARWGGGEVRGW